MCQKAARGDVQALDMFLEAGVAVDVVDGKEERNSPLHWAASFGSLPSVKYLLSKGVDVNIVNGAGNTPLMDAALGGHLEIVKTLVAAGADLARKDAKGRSLTQLPVPDHVLGLLHRADPVQGQTLMLPPQQSISGETDESDGIHVHRGEPSTPYYVPGERVNVFKDRDDLPAWARLLWPRPRRVVEGVGRFTVPPVITVSAEGQCMSVAKLFVKRLRSLELGDVSVRLVGGGQGGLGEAIAFSAVVFLRVDSCALDVVEQGYSLTVRDFGVDVVGADLSGLFYGCVTLVNVLELRRGEEGVALSIPACNVSDWPSIRRRGLYLDFSGTCVPKMETLERMVRFIAIRLKMNQLQVCIGTNFDRLEGANGGAKLTHEQLLDLGAICKEHFVELVPVINEGVLQSAENGAVPNGNTGDSYSSDIPEDMLFDEYIPLFEGLQVNIGDMGRGEGCDVTDFQRTRRLSTLLRARGKSSVQMFANKLLGILSDPAALSGSLAELPARGIMILEADDVTSPSLDEHCLRLRQNGLPFYTCVSSCLEDSIAGRLSILLNRCQISVNAAKQRGGAGVLMKDTSMAKPGAPIVFLFLALVPLAGVAWNCDEPISTGPEGPDELLSHLYDTYIFSDRPEKGILGNIAVSLGDLHTIAGDLNGTALFRILAQRYISVERATDSMTYIGLRRAVKRADRIESALSSYSGNANMNDVQEMRTSAIQLAVSARIGALLLSLSSTAAMDGEKPSDDTKIDLEALPDGRRSDLCNALLQSIELSRASWTDQFHEGGFAENVEAKVGETLARLAQGMPYQKYLSARKAENWVSVEE